ncbi:hypothetical protein A3Q56_01501 [Intoshia linei]|uniref:Uncharacterized protein n=1 Tax=Intoshia linei TaxID=1819745 RepID=A0A177BB34_9BILA|nr:hypothetical protein A3Q56_01501 [Intoshia linei]
MSAKMASLKGSQLPHKERDIKKDFYSNNHSKSWCAVTSQGDRYEKDLLSNNHP